MAYSAGDQGHELISLEHTDSNKFTHGIYQIDHIDHIDHIDKID